MRWPAGEVEGGGIPPQLTMGPAVPAEQRRAKPDLLGEDHRRLATDAGQRNIVGPAVPANEFDKWPDRGSTLSLLRQPCHQQLVPP
ncbi:MAG: hypothetical protein WBM67_16530, partial [Sedimenticolaceae bacterium]